MSKRNEGHIQCATGSKDEKSSEKKMVTMMMIISETHRTAEEEEEEKTAKTKGKCDTKPKATTIISRYDANFQFKIEDSKRAAWQYCAILLI